MEKRLQYYQYKQDIFITELNEWLREIRCQGLTIDYKTQFNLNVFFKWKDHNYENAYAKIKQVKIFYMAITYPLLSHSSGFAIPVA